MSKENTKGGFFHMNVKKNQGFSLVELMVVVAIIGIIATIAVPNFLKFQAKAKQSNAKTELSGIYTAEKAFFTEFATYHVNLPYIGYVPDGVPLDASNCPNTSSSWPTRYYDTGFSAGGSHATVSGLSSQPCGNSDANGVNYFGRSSNDAANGLTGATASSSAFTAAAAGSVSGSAADVWTIDQNKSLTNTTSGI